MLVTRSLGGKDAGAQLLHPAPKPMFNRSRAATFLGYHSIADRGPSFLSLPPELFDKHLRVLSRMGFRGGGLQELEALAAGRRPSRRRAFITFDDGYVDNHDTALPLLREHGLRAFVFIVPPQVDEGGPLVWPELADAQRAFPAILRSMTWPMVEAMAEAGTEIGSHTLKHRHLSELGDEELRQELLDSRMRIKERLGRCSVLAYPFGECDRRVEQAAADTGYSFAFTMPTGAQRRASQLSIPRIAIDHRDRPPRFAAKLTGPVRALLLSPLKDRLRMARNYAPRLRAART